MQSSSKLKALPACAEMQLTWSNCIPNLACLLSNFNGQLRQQNFSPGSPTNQRSNSQMTEQHIIILNPSLSDLDSRMTWQDSHSGVTWQLGKLGTRLRNNLANHSEQFGTRLSSQLSHGQIQRVSRLGTRLCGSSDSSINQAHSESVITLAKPKIPCHGV